MKAKIYTLIVLSAAIAMPVCATAHSSAHAGSSQPQGHPPAAASAGGAKAFSHEMTQLNRTIVLLKQKLRIVKLKKSILKAGSPGKSNSGQKSGQGAPPNPPHAHAGKPHGAPQGAPSGHPMPANMHNHHPRGVQHHHAHLPRPHMSVVSVVGLAGHEQATLSGDNGVRIVQVGSHVEHWKVSRINASGVSLKAGHQHVTLGFSGSGGSSPMFSPSASHRLKASMSQSVSSMGAPPSFQFHRARKPAHGGGGGSHASASH